MAENLEYYCMCLHAPLKTEAELRVLASRKAAIITSKMWPKNGQITVRFLSGSAALQKRVKDVAHEWEQYALQTFDFRNTGNTDIVIDFMPGKGSWSYLGTDCNATPKPNPTMNYGWLTDNSSDDELRLIHEHQNPLGGIKWNRQAVIKDLSGPPNNWDLAKIENNMFRYYPPEQLQASVIDAKSIMMYPIPKSWTKGGYFSTGMNNDFSATDKQVVRDAYS
jgi:serralysin